MCYKIHRSNWRLCSENTKLRQHQLDVTGLLNERNCCCSAHSSTPNIVLFLAQFFNRYIRFVTVLFIWISNHDEQWASKSERSTYHIDTRHGQNSHLMRRGTRLLLKYYVCIGKLMQTPLVWCRMSWTPVEQFSWILRLEVERGREREVER